MFGSKTKVLLRKRGQRGETLEMEVNLKAITEGIDSNILLSDRDIIYVPYRPF